MSAHEKPKSDRSRNGRTRLVTALSILAVVAAGSAAVTANIGILDSSVDGPMGQAVATGDSATSPGPVDRRVKVTTSSVAPQPGMDGSGVQRFKVDVAGFVELRVDAAGVTISRVDPGPGWKWSLSQSDPHELLVRLVNGARTFEFNAVSGADGKVVASVTEPVGNPVVTGDDHETSVDHHDDDDHDKDHEDYEGGEDDD